MGLMKRIATSIPLIHQALALERKRENKRKYMATHGKSKKQKVV